MNENRLKPIWIISTHAKCIWTLVLIQLAVVVVLCIVLFCFVLFFCFIEIISYLYVFLDGCLSNILFDLSTFNSYCVRFDLSSIDPDNILLAKCVQIWLNMDKRFAKLPKNGISSFKNRFSHLMLNGRGDSYRLVVSKFFGFKLQRIVVIDVNGNALLVNLYDEKENNITKIEGQNGR